MYGSEVSLLSWNTFLAARKPFVPALGEGVEAVLSEGKRDNNKRADKLVLTRNVFWHMQNNTEGPDEKQKQYIGGASCSSGTKPQL